MNFTSKNTILYELYVMFSLLYIDLYKVKLMSCA